jgi:hypothetical protein
MVCLLRVFYGKDFGQTAGGRYMCAGNTSYFIRGAFLRPTGVFDCVDVYHSFRTKHEDFIPRISEQREALGMSRSFSAARFLFVRRFVSEYDWSLCFAHAHAYARR